MEMNIFIAGASGATGKKLVEQLIGMDIRVKAIVRNPAVLPAHWHDYGDQLEIIQGSILEFTEEQMAEILQDCDAAASCLGHNLTWKGIYGQPRRLVTDAVRLMAHSIELVKPGKPIKMVLMNTTGNRNRNLEEKTSLGHKTVIGLLRLLLPPQVDNEEAAEYLRTAVGMNDQYLEWTVVRPDGLIDEDQVTPYETYPSPIRDPIFNAGKTSRINVGNFMARLIQEEELWNTWKGQMPVIYNKTETI